MSEIDRYQKRINGLHVARMVIEFHGRLRGAYPSDVMTSSLCAVGPLQTMIGLGIELGVLSTPETLPEVPKCTSWRGHRFEARYSLGSARRLTENENWWTPFSQRLETIDKARTKTYEGDVCVRCGCVVNRPTHQRSSK